MLLQLNWIWIKLLAFPSFHSVTLLLSSLLSSFCFLFCYYIISLFSTNCAGICWPAPDSLPGNQRQECDQRRASLHDNGLRDQTRTRARQWARQPWKHRPSYHSLLTTCASRKEEGLLLELKGLGYQSTCMYLQLVCACLYVMYFVLVPLKLFLCARLTGNV